MAQRDVALLDRLSSSGAAIGGSGAFDRHVAHDSVRRNLERLANSRRGTADAQIDYGLPEIDFGRGIPEAVDQLRKAIADNVRSYEPRLMDVSVLPAEVGDGDRPAVLVEGRHIADPEGQYTAFIIVYESPGRATVGMA